jgi:hypothetical protein
MLRNILFVLIGTILFIGFFFKFMHWPSAGPMLSISLGGISLLSVMYTISKRKPKLWVQHILLPVFGTAFSLSVLFKIMAWPFANVLLVISMTGISLTFLEATYRMRKSITAAIPAMFAITMVLALFKIMHWLTLDILSFLILFLTASIPLLVFIRGKQLKQTEPGLSFKMMMVAALTLISGLIEFIFVMLGIFLNLSYSLTNFTQVVLSMGIILVIRKTIQTEDLKTKSENDDLLMHCLGSIYIITLIFHVMENWN